MSARYLFMKAKHPADLHCHILQLRKHFLHHALIQPCRRCRDTHRCHRLPCPVSYGHRNTADTCLMLLIVNGIAPAPCQIQFLPQLFQICDGLCRKSSYGFRFPYSLHFFPGQLCQNTLAHTGAVHGVTQTCVRTIRTSCRKGSALYR